MCFANQDTYDGEWMYGLKEGKGRYNYSNGDVYIGPFHLDKR